MCQQHTESTAPQPTTTTQGSESRKNDHDHGHDPFPWDAGVFDAHCHPTDTMGSIPRIRTMGARTLTLMSTRSQDQDLVAAVASDLGIHSQAALFSPPSATTSSSAAEKVVPAFGWHPWFSHELYDDSLPAAETTYDASAAEAGKEARQAQKARHYAAVLTPSPNSNSKSNPDNTDAGTGTAFTLSLPTPRPLSAFLSAARTRLTAHEHALVGEVGLDRAFRLPSAWLPGEEEAASRARREEEEDEEDPAMRPTPGGRAGRRLSPYQVRPAHQVAVMAAQLRLAGEMGRAASVHGVQAHGMLFDALRGLWRGHEREVLSRRQMRMVAPGAEDDDEEDFLSEEGEDARKSGAGNSKKKKKSLPYPPRICLHSFSGSAQILKQYLDPAIPARIFFSFSIVVNTSTTGGEAKFPDVVRACPDDRILVESDLHMAGSEMDGYLEQMYRRVCEIKGWELREGVKRIGRNYEEFIFG